MQTDYIIDTDTIKILMPTLHQKITINPAFLCKNILDNVNTRNNVYYYVLDEYNRVNGIYGIYKNSNEYMRNDLNYIASELDLVKSECKERAFHIN